MNTVFKIHGRILENKVGRIIEYQLSNVQSGFRVKHVQNHIFMVQHVTEKRLANIKKIYLCSTEIISTFETVKGNNTQ